VELELTAEQKLLRDTAAEFARGEIEPKAAEIDRERRFPHEIVEKLGRLGMMGMCVPRELGGAGGDAVAYVLAL
jgi:alkylation response protein AidB-like acyl-CoA dehydrogenase